MSKQTEALRWAGILEHQARYDGPTDYKHKAAAELRRLEQSEREGWRYADELEQERKRLSNLNAELVDVLVEAGNFIQPFNSADELLEKIDTTLAKAKELQ